VIGIPADRGLLVTLDGPGGAGKSTAGALVAERLTSRGVPVLATTEPSQSELGKLARAGTERYRGLALACLVAADRYDHLETEIRPALAQGQVVVCDRYVAASLVLQRMDGVDEAMIWDLARYVELPDLAIILTARAELLVTRIAARGGSHSRFERDPANSAVEASLYEAAADALRSRGVYVVAMDSSSAPAETIADGIVELVENLLSRRRSGRWVAT
jgi:dTMP kinase